MKKISIIIPVYNAKNYLIHCVKSILKQPNVEIILVDDGSTDGSGAMCDSFAEEKNVIVKHTMNKGVSHARNLGLQIASGEYVSFMDADDWIEKQYIEKIQKILETVPGVDLINFGYKRDFDGQEIYSCIPSQSEGKIKLKEHGIRQDFFEMGYWRVVWNKVYRMDLIKNNRLIFSPYQINEDSLFNINYFMYCSSIYFCPNAYYHYMSYVKTKGLSQKVYPNIFSIYIEEQDKFEILLDQWSYSEREKAQIIINTLYPQYYNAFLKIILNEEIEGAKKKEILDSAIDNKKINDVLKGRKTKWKENIIKNLILRKKYNLINVFFRKRLY